MEFRIKPVIVLLLVMIASAAAVRAPFAKTATSGTQISAVEPITVSSSRGRINENYSYEGLEVRRGSYQSRRYGGRVYSCSFTGKINSTTHTEKRNVKVLFAARNNFKELLWEAVVSIKSLPAFETYEFSEKITCQDRDPYYWTISVVEEAPSGEKE